MRRQEEGVKMGGHPSMSNGLVRGGGVPKGHPMEN